MIFRIAILIPSKPWGHDFTIFSFFNVPVSIKYQISHPVWFHFAIFWRSSWFLAGWHQTFTKMWKYTFWEKLFKIYFEAGSFHECFPFTSSNNGTFVRHCVNQMWREKRPFKVKNQDLLWNVILLVKVNSSQHCTLLILKNKILIVQWQHRMEFIGTF